jgi:hypothetical protein
MENGLLISLARDAARIIRTSAPDPPPALVAAVVRGEAIEDHYGFRCQISEAIRLRDAAAIATEQAHERLLSGVLPYEAITRTLAGVGDGTQRCAVCDGPIVGPVEIRVHFLEDSPRYFHGRCHHAWLRQRDSSGEGG